MKHIALFTCVAALAVSTGAVAATAKPAKPVKAESALTAKFKAWDSNHDGTLTQAELIPSSMSAKSQKYATRVIASADRNHDGKIGPKEFTKSVEVRLAKVEG